jgi:hypothetical protein
MRPVHVLLTAFLLWNLCPRSPAQEVFLQQEGKFLYPPNLSTGGDNVLLGMTIGSVVGFPITATIDAENTRTDAHGKSIVVRFRSKIYRDSKGRTRLEWDMTPLNKPPKPGWFAIEIYDPTTRTSLHLQPSTKTASRSHFPAPDEKPQPVCQDSDLPKIDPEALAQLPVPAPQVIQIELAHDVVENMVVRRGRESVKPPPGSSTRNPAYATLTDYWFSQQLQAFVLVKRIGPGKSQHTIKLSNISRDEPGVSLFAVPPDYNVSESKACCGNCSPELSD